VTTIQARGLHKFYGSSVALNSIDLNVKEGRILGLIGPNGAGKTTLLNAILGLTSYQGSLTVLGRNPWTQRDQLMRDVAFIADVAVLPRWMRVSDAVVFVAGVHPRFNRAKAEAFLARTTIKRTSKVRELSKGTLPPLALAVLEVITLHTTYFFKMMAYRVHGPEGLDFTASNMSMASPMHISPAQFLSTPGLWTGLALAAVFLAAAIQLRRYRNPI
jgi:ABC-type transport system involved in cytochrome c biogenesis ATPase subunit